MTAIARILAPLAILLCACAVARAATVDESALAKRLYGHWSDETGFRNFYFAPGAYFMVQEGRCLTAPLVIVEETLLNATLIVRIQPDRGDEATDWRFQFSHGGDAAMVSARSRYLVRTGVITFSGSKAIDRTPLSQLPFGRPSPTRKVSDVRLPSQSKCEPAP
jgi:hypothetical protein